VNGAVRSKRERSEAKMDLQTFLGENLSNKIIKMFA